MIRMSTSQMFNTNLNNMMQSQGRVNYTNNQMGSGKRVLTPADDPVAAAQTLNSKTRLSVVEQQNRNVDFADKNLSQTESVLNQTEMSLIRLKEISIQLGSDQWSDEQIRSTGTEAAEILNHLQGLSNTQNESGEYIFAGSQANQPAYRGNEFQGDRIEREAQVSDSTFIKMNTSGDRAFENLEGLSTPVPVKEDADFSLPKGADELLSFQSQKQDLVENSGSPDELVSWLASDDSGALLFPSSFSEAERKEYIVENWDAIADTLGTPWSDVNGSDLSIDANGAVIDAGDAWAANDVANAAVPAGGYPDNMLGSIQQLVDATGNGNPPGEVNREGIRASISNLDIAFEQVSQTRAQIGARQNTLDAVKESNKDFELFAQKSISELEDLDYAEAIVRFETQMMSLQASQQVFGRVSNLSLFNYI